MMKRFRRPSPALILSVIAVVLALTGTAVAAGSIKLGAFTDGTKNKTVGVGKLTYATATTNATAPDQAVTPAQCPSGLNVIGGGIKLSNPSGTSFIEDSHPTSSGWAGAVRFTAPTQSAITTAICAKSRVVTGTPGG
jgi:hypothetical protein